MGVFIFSGEVTQPLHTLLSYWQVLSFGQIRQDTMKWPTVSNIYRVWPQSSAATPPTLISHDCAAWTPHTGHMGGA